MISPPEGIVLGFAGRSGSGKSRLSKDVAVLLGWRRAAFGDYVRRVAVNRGLDPNDALQLLSLGEQLVEEQCDEFCEEVLGMAGWRPGESVVLDGIRHLRVVRSLEHLAHPSSFRLVFVDASAQVREQRLLERRGADGPPLVMLDAHSTAVDADVLRGLADHTANGEGSPEAVARAIARMAGKAWARPRSVP